MAGQQPGLPNVHYKSSLKEKAIGQCLMAFSFIHLFDGY